MRLMKNGKVTGFLNDPGSYFGKSALLTKKPNQTTVVAGDDVNALWSLNSEDWDKFFNDPDLQRKITMSITQQVAEDLQAVREDVKGILKAFGKSESRAASSPRRR